MFGKFLPRLIKLDSGKRFDCHIVSLNQTIIIGDPHQIPEFKLVFKNVWIIVKALLSRFNVLTIVEMFLNKEIDCEGDILKLFRIKNHIHLPFVKLN